MADLIQPAPVLARLSDAIGKPSPEWVRWFQQVFVTGGTVSTNNAAIAALQTRVGADEANIAANSSALTALQDRATADEASIAANTTAIAGKLTAANNLSDVPNVATARANLNVDAAGAWSSWTGDVNANSHNLSGANNIAAASLQISSYMNFSGSMFYLGGAGTYFRTNNNTSNWQEFAYYDVQGANAAADQWGLYVNTRSSAGGADGWFPVMQVNAQNGNTQFNVPVTITGTTVLPSATTIGGSSLGAVAFQSTVPIGNGGTGQTSQQTAINALTGTQAAGKYLRSDGSNATLSSIQAGDVPTLNQSTTGTAANVTGVVAIANGGTGQTSASAALSALGGASLSATNTFASDQFFAGSVALAPANAATAAATNSLVMNPIYTASTRTQVARIDMVRPSTTAGNYDGYLAFLTRLTGSSITEAARVTQNGNLLVGTTTDNATDKMQVSGSLTASTVKATGGLYSGVRTVTANDTATTSDHTIILNGTSLTETLPAAPGAGQELYLVNIAGTSVTVSGNAKSIWAAGTSSASITLAANTTAILQYDGTLWRQIK